MLNGSSVGARPKILVNYNPITNKWLHGPESKIEENAEPWIIKFPTYLDGNDAGAIEYVYSLLAQQCEISIPKTQLIESPHHQGYFAVKRFDRLDDKQFHIHSISGIVHHNFRTPSLDYEHIFETVQFITQSKEQLESLFK